MVHKCILLYLKSLDCTAGNGINLSENTGKQLVTKDGKQPKIIYFTIYRVFLINIDITTFSVRFSRVFTELVLNQKSWTSTFRQTPSSPPSLDMFAFTRIVLCFFAYLFQLYHPKKVLLSI